MTSPQRVRVLTPEALDAAAANLVNTANTALRAAVSQYAGTSTQNGTSGVSAATPSTIIARDANARAQVATPSASADISTKGYVDTTVAGYIPATQKGVASGIASLDGSGFVTVAQIPQNLGRSLGTGINLPAGARQGDTFYHTGVGCLFEWNSAKWVQQEEPVVANNAALLAISTSYNNALYNGFKALQTDYGIRWMWTGTIWVPTNPQVISGKLWRTAGFSGNMIANTNYSVVLDSGRVSGGFTQAHLTSANAFSTPFGNCLTVPYDGIYDLMMRCYATGGPAPYDMAFYIRRGRSGMSDISVVTNSFYKETGWDRMPVSGDKVPLKAGDQLAMWANSGVGGANYWGNSEIAGVVLSATYYAPLNGAVPV